MTDEQESQLIKEKIAAFFNKLNDEENITVVCVNLQWLEHLENGEHDKYFLQDCDVNIKL